MTDSVSKADALEPIEEGPSGEPMEPVEQAQDPVDVAEDGVGTEGEGEHAEGEPGSEAEAHAGRLREELESLNDRHLRLAAEFTNYRRRVEQERTGLWSRAQGEFVEKLLEALDDLQRVAGLDLGNATVEAIMEGIDLVDRKFARVLADAGVEVVDPVGARFDPQTMEAMMRVPAESEEEDERVAMVFQKGYALKGQLLRPARVSVRKLG